MIWAVILSLMTVDLVFSKVYTPEVHTLSGSIKGYYKFSNNGTRYRAYEGIPYAKPPIGTLRFEPPEPVEAWSNVLVADSFGSDCSQYNHYPTTPEEYVVGSEDCLYMNIYAAEQDEANNSLPVMFYIYGGAFSYGASRTYEPLYFLDRPLIMVSMNYRVGVMGFLSTEDDVVPGNMALKDQSTALRWVYENIASFGGDPNKITIVGGSAGATSVHLHSLSPWSKGLFRGCLSSSGTALQSTVLIVNPLRKTKKLAAILNCTTETNSEMIDCLKSRPAVEIVKTVPHFQVWMQNPTLIFGPVVEKGGAHPFINRSPIEIIASGDAADVPWVTGVTSQEGALIGVELVLNTTIAQELDANWDALLPHLLFFNDTVPKDKHSAVARKIREHYFGSHKIDKSTATSVMQMIGDRIFVKDAPKSAIAQARANRNSSVWFYLYSYRGAHSLTEWVSGSNENFGACHGDDVNTIFETRRKPMSSTPEDRAMQKILLDLWVSFVTNGAPDVGTEWQPLDPSASSIRYLNLAGPENITMETATDMGNMKFWDTIASDENRL